MGYNVYLPPRYADGTQQRYPVIYFLHGAGGNENSDAGGFSGLIQELIRRSTPRTGRSPHATGALCAASRSAGAARSA